MKSIILASGSPRRKKLLEQINMPFQVQVSTVSEEYDPDLPPADIVQVLARRKAEDIAQNSKDALIIGADTIVSLETTVLEKPRTAGEAEKMLHKLSDQTHSVLTGVALCKTDRSGQHQTHSFFEETYVTFGKLSPDDIEHYVKSGSPMDKAGAYGIQDDYGALFVKRIAGDYNTVVGFPLYAFYQELKKFAPKYRSAIKGNP